MKVSKNILVMISMLLATTAYSQALKNTFYVNQSGEKVLRLEFLLPVDLTTAWNYFTTDQKLQQWIAPLAHIELKSGGYIITNYDSTKTLKDSSSIKLPVLSFIDNELLVLKVILNSNFTSVVRDSDENLQEIIQFVKMGNQQTKIISSMVGWGSGNDWDKTYHFFEKGNEWTYQELLKNFK